jgi:hypothetical protein
VIVDLSEEYLKHIAESEENAKDVDPDVVQFLAAEVIRLRATREKGASNE